MRMPAAQPCTASTCRSSEAAKYEHEAKRALVQRIGRFVGMQAQRPLQFVADAVRLKHRYL
jgi:hypothetical protein